MPGANGRRGRRLRGGLAALLLSAAVSVWAAPESVVVSGLSSSRAILEIDGKRRVLRPGETSPEGVTLIEVNSRRAILEIDGAQAEFPLGDRIQTGFAAPEAQVVHVPLSPSGLYLAPGKINGRLVTFQVDTGATAVALSSDLADQVGIDYAQGERQQIMTASGVTYAYSLIVDEIAVGTIVQRNVRAAVLEGQLPRWPLLGMTFLGNVKITQGESLLELRSR